MNTVDARALFDALAALKAVLDIEHRGGVVIPAPVYMQVLRSHAALNVALAGLSLKVEVTQ